MIYSSAVPIAGSAKRWPVVLCAATGPSFSRGQAEAAENARLRGAIRIIAINDAYLRLPNADVLYACDGAWWTMHFDRVHSIGVKSELWTQHAKTAEKHRINHVPGLRGTGLCRNRFAIHTGGNSGYQAIGLAHLFGARTILLVGYDMQRTGGKAHFFGDHPEKLGQGNPATMAHYFPALGEELKAEGIDVINCTTQTALTCFRRALLSDTLRGFAQ